MKSNLRITLFCLALLHFAASGYSCNENVKLGFKEDGGSSSSSSSGGDGGSDSDGLKDDDDDGLSNSVENTARTDDQKFDSDHDGFDDGLEFIGEGGDPLNGEADPTPFSKRRTLPTPEGLINSDTDGDGLGSGFEEESSLDPNSADSDEDGYADGLELLAGSDPTDSDSRPTRSSPPSSDGITRTGSPPTDSDGDGLSDSLESQVGSRAQDPDSDDDGYGDGLEYLAGSSATDNLVVPNFQLPASSSSSG